MCQGRQMPVENWDLLVPEAILLMNNQVNKSMGYSANQFLFGEDARVPLDNFYQLENFGIDIPTPVVRTEAVANRIEAQQAYKRQHDKNCVKKKLFLRWVILFF